jgi:hypothetical protein
MQEAQDHELKALRKELEARRKRVAELEFELFETRSQLTVFERHMEKRLGPLKAEVNDLRARIAEIRRQAELRGQWGEAGVQGGPPVDVVEQFRRTWQPDVRTSAPPAPPKREESPQDEALKERYRALARKFHPDLVTDPREKEYRLGVMKELNAAYSAGDLARLEDLERLPDRRPQEEGETREALLREMAEEIARLDQVVARLEGELESLISSETVQLMLKQSIALHEGRDLLLAMEEELQAQAAQLRQELASLRP